MHTIKATILKTIREARATNSIALPSLPAIYDASRAESIGQFHDAIRAMVAEGSITLQPYTGPMYKLERGELAIIMGQEIKFYASV